jgi:hypothetical protein
MLNWLFKRPGLIREEYLRNQLNFARSIGKRVDEHREVVERLDRDTDFFTNYPWHADHMATQDDFLMRLYHLVHASWPQDAPVGDNPRGRQSTGEYVRPRPAVLGTCRLPEYLAVHTQVPEQLDAPGWQRARRMSRTTDCAG